MVENDIHYYKGILSSLKSKIIGDTVYLEQLLNSSKSQNPVEVNTPEHQADVGYGASNSQGDANS